MKLGNVEAMVLVTLSGSARGLHVFTIYKRLRYPLGDVLRSMFKLEELGLLSLNEDEHATLTEAGADRACKIASKVSTKSAKAWQEVPDRFKKHQDKSDLDFYIPRTTLLDKYFFC